MAMVETFGMAGRAEWMRWGSSFAIVLTAHVVVSAAILNNIQPSPARPSPPSIMMVDLPIEALLPVAQSVESIAADAVAEIVPEEEVPDQPLIEDVVETVPETVEAVMPEVTEMREAEIAELVEPVETVTAKPVVEPEKKPEQVKKPKPKPKPQTASNAANNSRAASGASRQSAQIESRYISDVRAAIFRNRRAVPANLHGRAMVGFVINRSGAISRVRLHRSSGSAAIDRIALDTVRRTGRVKPIPRELGRSSLPLIVPFGRR